MTDQGLLEMAAKAAGVTGFWVDAGLNTGSNAAPRIWNPLIDDGDALRLAVKLGIQVTPGTYNKEEASAFSPVSGVSKEYRHYLQDMEFATRRAIVHAAAGVGKLI